MNDIHDMENMEELFRMHMESVGEIANSLLKEYKEALNSMSVERKDEATENILDFLREIAK